MKNASTPTARDAARPAVDADRVGSAVAGALSELERRMRAKFGARLAGMTLFGSRARGTAGPESDVDVLVLVEGLTGSERAAVYELGADVTFDTRVHLAPLALSTEEYREMLSLERSLALDVEREGLRL